MFDGEIYGIPNPNPLKINTIPMKTATYGIAFWILFRIEIVRKELRYTTLLISGTVPNPNKNIYKIPKVGLCIAIAPNNAT